MYGIISILLLLVIIPGANVNWIHILHNSLPTAIADSMKEIQSRFRALGNMGDVLIKMEQVEEAIKVYQKQLTLSKQSREKTYEATAYGSLGVCHRLSKQFDKALGYHTQVSALIYQNTSD